MLTILTIKALSDELVQSIGIKQRASNQYPDQDPNLLIRKSAFCIPVVQVNEARTVGLDLKAYEELSFLRGFQAISYQDQTRHLTRALRFGISHIVIKRLP